MKAFWPDFFASLGFAKRPFNVKTLEDQLQWNYLKEYLCSRSLFIAFKMKIKKSSYFTYKIILNWVNVFYYIYIYMFINSILSFHFKTLTIKCINCYNLNIIANTLILHSDYFLNPLNQGIHWFGKANKVCYCFHLVANMID